MEKSTIFSAPFLHYLLPPGKKYSVQGYIYWVKTTNIDNQYDLYSRTCADGSSMFEGVDFTVSYSPVAGIFSLCIIIEIASS